ncbi:sulfur carrier protein ThiS [Roseateles terrae]|uniref:Sulfur carrier protein n=1 Tax=Roseateles terrae TaxID=431060 RepID=A0ABR6GYW5_9BURK|nr:sulfur carrier protein ThiS [Roseateles terrae]MBB3197259.1 sulfur carrier protein [Roseateles terrae]
MTADTITIRLDDRPLQVPAGSHLSDLLAREALVPTSVATALNGRFVPRAARAATPLSDGDQVLLFQPIVGG